MSTPYDLVGNVIPGVIVTLAGLAAIIFSKRISRGSVRFNEVILGHRFSEAYYRVGYLIGGGVFVVVGLLALFGVVQFRH